MKVIYLSQALRDMAWVRIYYNKVFPQGRGKAGEQLRKFELLIVENPNAGRASENVWGARELLIARTPFSFIYAVRPRHIEILRVVDNRSNWLADEND